MFFKVGTLTFWLLANSTAELTSVGSWKSTLSLPLERLPSRTETDDGLFVFGHQTEYKSYKLDCGPKTA